MLAIYEGSGVDFGLVLIMVAILMISGIMLRSSIFDRATAYAGLIKVILFHCTGITITARGQEEFDRLTLLGDHQMQFEPIKEALFASLISSPRFASIQATAVDAVVIASGHRKAVEDLDRVRIRLLPGFIQLAKQGQEQVRFAVPAPVETTWREGGNLLSIHSPSLVKQA